MKKLYAVICFFLFSVTGFSQWFWQNPFPQGNWLASISFSDPIHGYALGGAGTILKTSNSGTDWTVISTGTCGYLYSASFPDVDTGYAVG